VAKPPMAGSPSAPSHSRALALRQSMLLSFRPPRPPTLQQRPNTVRALPARHVSSVLLLGAARSCVGQMLLQRPKAFWRTQVPSGTCGDASRPRSRRVRLVLPSIMLSESWVQLSQSERKAF
jgi:hypothetical protein